MRNDIQDIGEKLPKRNAELIRNPTIKDLINIVNITKIELDLKCINGAQIRSKKNQILPYIRKNKSKTKYHDRTDYRRGAKNES